MGGMPNDMKYYKVGFWTLATWPLFGLPHLTDQYTSLLGIKRFFQNLTDKITVPLIRSLSQDFGIAVRLLMKELILCSDCMT